MGISSESNHLMTFVHNVQENLARRKKEQEITKIIRELEDLLRNQKILFNTIDHQMPEDVSKRSPEQIRELAPVIERIKLLEEKIALAKTKLPNPKTN